MTQCQRADAAHALLQAYLHCSLQPLEHAHCINPGVGHAVIQQLHLQILEQLARQQTPLPLCQGS